MKATILGSGFGLYGYLPALIACNVSVILPMRYQSIILQRPDLAHYYSLIEWAPSEDIILSQCDAIIIALPPAQQINLLKKCLGYSNLNYYLLEKPLAVSPSEANYILELMTHSKKKFRIGYNFRWTDWGKTLLKQNNGLEEIIWEFHAHHYAKNIQTWKRFHKEGGGALRFYGIHLIALLAEIGYKNVLFSETIQSNEGELESWTGILGGTHLSNCRVTIHTHSMNSIFQVKHNKNIYTFTHPFEAARAENNSIDMRVPYLISTLRDLLNDDRQSYDWYKQVNQLWQSIEEFA